MTTDLDDDWFLDVEGVGPTEEISKKIPADLTKNVRRTLKILRGKGWDESSIVLGFAIGHGFSLSEALVLAGDVRYPPLGKSRPTR